MKKNTVRTAVVWLILLAVYHVIVFAVPFTHNGAFWLSYVFALAAFAVLGAATYLGEIKGEGVKSKFYGFPILRLGAVYFAVQIVLSLIVMAVAVVKIWVALVVYVILLGAAAIGLIAADAVREEIQRQDVKLKKDVSFMRNLQSKVCQMATQCDAPELKKFAEDIRYSDPVSSDALGDIEQELAAAVEELQAAVVDGDSESVAQLCRKASAVLSERNRLCKLGKNR